VKRGVLEFVVGFVAELRAKTVVKIGLERFPAVIVGGVVGVQPTFLHGVGEILAHVIEDVQLLGSEVIIRAGLDECGRHQGIRSRRWRGIRCKIGTGDVIGRFVSLCRSTPDRFGIGSRQRKILGSGRSRRNSVNGGGQRPLLAGPKNHRDGGTDAEQEAEES